MWSVYRFRYRIPINNRSGIPIPIPINNQYGIQTLIPIPTLIPINNRSVLVNFNLRIITTVCHSLSCWTLSVCVCAHSRALANFCVLTYKNTDTDRYSVSYRYRLIIGIGLPILIPIQINNRYRHTDTDTDLKIPVPPHLYVKFIQWIKSYGVAKLNMIFAGDTMLSL